MNRPDSDPYRHIPLPGPGTAARYAIRILALVGRSALKVLLAVAGVTVVLALLPVTAAYVGQLLVDAVATVLNDPDPALRKAAQDMAMIYAVAEGALLAGIMSARWLLQYLKRLLQVETAYVANRAIFAKTAGFGLAALEGPQIQQQIVLARQNANTRPYSFINRIFDGGQNLLSLVSVSALLAVFSPGAVALVVLGGVPLFLSELYFSGTAFRLISGKSPEMRRRNYLANLLTSDAAAAERIFAQADPQLRQAYEDLYADSVTDDRRLLRRRTMSGLALMLTGTSAFLGTAVWVVWSATRGDLTLGAMTMYLALLRQGQTATQSLLSTCAGAYEDLLYVSNFLALIDTPDPQPRGDRRVGKAPGDGYRLEGVGFTYTGMDRPSVDRVTLHLPPGSRLGIVGANGSGKTTLVKLLTGLYLPTAGRLTLDGTELGDWAPDALYARASALFQPFMRYRFTLADTIAMGEGLRIRDPARLELAARRGQAQSVLEMLPDGLRTRLSRETPDGRELSSGQWQRLALARAMLREKADMLILDEPTSALDPAAEAAFLDSIRDLPCSLVLVSHQLANLRNMDRIIMMAGGRIVESGSHLELMAAGGEYARLYRQQAEPYELKSAG